MFTGNGCDAVTCGGAGCATAPAARAASAKTARRSIMSAFREMATACRRIVDEDRRSGLQLLARGSDPRAVFGDVGEDRRIVLEPAAHRPRRDSDQLVLVQDRTHQRSSAVAAAGKD